MEIADNKPFLVRLDSSRTHLYIVKDKRANEGLAFELFRHPPDFYSVKQNEFFLIYSQATLC